MHCPSTWSRVWSFLSSHRFGNGVDDAQLQLLIIGGAAEQGGDIVAQQVLVDSARSNVIADVLRVTQERLRANKISVVQQHLRAEDYRDSLVAIDEAVKLAGAEEQVRQLVSERRVIVIILDVLQHRVQLADIQLP